MNILITRPDSRGQQLVDLLAEQNIFAIHQPLFSIEAGRELAQLPSILSRLNSGDYVFAVSKNAVDFAAQTLKDTGFSWRGDLHYFAVGQGTANYFCAEIAQAVNYPIQSENSEALLELPQMQHLHGKQIVILRADSGREFFTEQAVLGGASVQAVECYQRVVSDLQLGEKLSLAKRAGIDTILATSREILSLLVSHTAESDRDWLFECGLVCLGKRVADYAQKAGWKQDKISIAERADNHYLLEFLLKQVKSK